MEEVKFIDGDWVYDIETYPNCFTFCIVKADGKYLKVFEISSRKNEQGGLFKCLDYLCDNEQVLVGFNNIGFDYPIVHQIY